jgi:hypothetical protein
MRVVTGRPARMRPRTVAARRSAASGKPIGDAIVKPERRSFEAREREHLVRASLEAFRISAHMSRSSLWKTFP